MLIFCDYHWQDAGIVIETNNLTNENTDTQIVLSQEVAVQAKYQRMHDSYSDIVGYLSIQNTGVSYCVFQSQDNEYYLHRNRDGKKTFSGEIYLDYRCDIKYLKPHIIIYGHNMRNNSMFGSLDKYKKENFYKDNPTITFNTIYEDYQWEIFSVRIVNVDDTGSTIIRTQFDSDEEWYQYIQNCQKDSIYKIPVQLCKGDVVLTLMTCSSEYDNGRLLIQARLIK